MNPGEHPQRRPCCGEFSRQSEIPSRDDACKARHTPGGRRFEPALPIARRLLSPTGEQSIDPIDLPPRSQFASYRSSFFCLSERPSCNPLADHAIGEFLSQIGQGRRAMLYERTRAADALAYCQPVGTSSTVSEFLKEPGAVAEQSPASASEIGGWVF
jgi:hypothetical protein